MQHVKCNISKNIKYKDLNYVKPLFILALTIAGCVSISAFASLVCVPIGITSSAVGINICAITAGIKKYKSIIKKRKSMIKQFSKKKTS